MKKRSKLFSFLITTFIICILCTVSSFAAYIVKSGFCGDNIYYTLDSNGLLILSGSGPMDDYSDYDTRDWKTNSTPVKSLIIEDGITSIGKNAFRSCIELTSAVIPDSITSIGEYAFCGCVLLNELTIPEGIEKISAHSFGSIAVKSIVIPDGVKSIEPFAFSHSVAESIIIPDSVTNIDEQAFKSTEYYKNEDNWENGVLYIGNYLIEANTNIEGTYTVKQGTTAIAASAFNSCTALTSVIVPGSVKYIGDSAFSNCTSLTNVTISKGLKCIGTQAFEKCSALKSITLPDGVNSIGYGTFQKCTSLSTISLPDTITHIGSNCFTDTAFFNDANNWTNDVLYIKKYLICAKNNIKGSYRVKKGTVLIADYAFCDCNYLSGINLQNAITHIGSLAFNNCYILKDVLMPDTVIEIGDYAFSQCKALVNITLSKKLVSIGNYAFSVSGLTSITLPDSVKSIGDGVFSHCPELTNVTLSKNITNISDHTFSDSPKLTGVIIPYGVSKIGKKAFNGCISLATVTIPTTVTEIGVSAFYKCEMLKKVDIPQSVERIGDYAFSCCSGITEVVFPDNIKSIGTSTFIKCSSIKSIVIPNGVTNIGNDAFFGCTALENVVIPDSVFAIGASAFSKCTALANISLPDDIISIGEYAFYNTAYYKNADNWKNDVLYIGKYLIRAKTSISGEYKILYGTECISDEAFYDCNKLTSVIIPDGIKYIGDYNFSHCEALTSVTIPHTAVIIKYNAINYSDDNITVYCDADSFGEYYANRKLIKNAKLIRVGLHNFVKSQSYTQRVFTDVAVSDWYYGNVASAYEYSIMNGKGESTFEPIGNITIAEVITIAARMNSIYYNGTTETIGAHSSDWYIPYVTYAQENGILDEFDLTYINYDAHATRTEFAQILAHAISEKDLGQINIIPDGAIPDVNTSNPYANSVYLLYRAGILTGSDSRNSFMPDTTITRAEAAAIITRIINKNLRVSFELENAS